MSDFSLECDGNGNFYHNILTTITKKSELYNAFANGVASVSDNRMSCLDYDNYDNDNTSLESLDEMFDDIYPFVNLFKTKCEKFLRDKIEKEGGSINIPDDQLIMSIANRSEVINKISSVGDNIEFSTKNGYVFFASSLSPEELYNVVEQFNNLKIN